MAGPPDANGDSPGSTLERARGMIQSGGFPMTTENLNRAMMALAVQGRADTEGMPPLPLVPGNTRTGDGRTRNEHTNPVTAPRAPTTPPSRTGATTPNTGNQQPTRDGMASIYSNIDKFFPPGHSDIPLPPPPPPGAPPARGAPGSASAATPAEEVLPTPPEHQSPEVAAMMNRGGDAIRPVYPVETAAMAGTGLWGLARSLAAGLARRGGDDPSADALYSGTAPLPGGGGGAGGGPIPPVPGSPGARLEAPWNLSRTPADPRTALPNPGTPPRLGQMETDGSVVGMVQPPIALPGSGGRLMVEPPPPVGQISGSAPLGLAAPGASGPAIRLPNAGASGGPPIPMSGRTVPRLQTDRGNVGRTQDTATQRSRAISDELRSRRRADREAGR